MSNGNLHPWLEEAAAAGFVMMPKGLAHKLGVEVAVLFSEILQREHYFKERNMLTKDGFFFNTNKDMSSGTGISERSLKRLYQVLEQHGLVEIQLRGMPKRTHIRVCYENKDFFEQFLQEGIEKLYEKESQVKVSHIGGGVGKELRDRYKEERKNDVGF